MSKRDELIDLGILGAAQNPDWQEQSDTEGAPFGVNDGIDISHALKTLISIPIRQKSDHRSGDIFVNHSGDSEYIVEANGVSVSASVVDSSSDLGALSSISDAINSDAEMSEIIVSSIDDSEEFLEFGGLEDEDFEFDIYMTAGTGEIWAEIDPVSATAWVWLYNSDHWGVPPGAEFGIDRRGGAKERFTTAGLERIYVEVEAEEPTEENVSARNIVAHIGPCIIEED